MQDMMQEFSACILNFHILVFNEKVWGFFCYLSGQVGLSFPLFTAESITYVHMWTD